jgi:hypothetical protein
MDPKVPPKFISPTKPLESSTMTQEERKEKFYQIGKVEKKIDENMKDMENNMDENRKEMENSMEENMSENGEHVEKKMN